MAKTIQKKVLIIGGGIAGPAAAIALQRVGIDAIVYEARQTSEQNKGAFLTVARNGINALHTIDAFEAVMARGFWVSRMEISSGTGKRLGEMGSTAEGVGIERSQLASALCDEAIRRGIPVQTGKRLINVRTTPDGVTVQFEDGSLANGDLLIGADGIHSRIRNFIDAQAPLPKPVGLIGVGGWAKVPGIQTVPEIFTFVLGKRAFFGWVPSPNGEIYWFANIPSSLRADKPERQTVATVSRQEWKQRLLELFAHDATSAAEIIRSTAEHDGFTATLLNMLPHVPLWHRESMVLVGDAAHAASPTSGQGASLALEDSIMLAKCLRVRSAAPSARGESSQISQESKPDKGCWADSARLSRPAPACGVQIPCPSRSRDLALPLSNRLG